MADEDPTRNVDVIDLLDSDSCNNSDNDDDNNNAYYDDDDDDHHNNNTNGRRLLWHKRIEGEKSSSSSSSMMMKSALRDNNRRNNDAPSRKRRKVTTTMDNNVLNDDDDIDDPPCPVASRMHPNTDTVATKTTTATPNINIDIGTNASTSTTNTAKKHNHRQHLEAQQQPQRHSRKRLQAGLVLEEDLFDNGGANNAYYDDNSSDSASASLSIFLRRRQQERMQQQQQQGRLQPLQLYEDPDFPPVSSSIQGMHEKSILQFLLPGASKSKQQQKQNNNNNNITIYYPKCRCGLPCQLSYKKNRPYFSCANTTTTTTTIPTSTTKKKCCQWFAWAFTAELMPWYRFGRHNHHQLVLPKQRRQQQQEQSYSFSNSYATSNHSYFFSAQDLVQGKVGDCWFLSALAVVAERPDLIQRLLLSQQQRKQQQGRRRHQYNNPALAAASLAASAATAASSGTDATAATAAAATDGCRAILDDWYQDDQLGIVRVNLFVDGWWTQIIMDNFLPCMIGQISSPNKEDDGIKQAIEASLRDRANTTTTTNNNNEGNKTIRNPYAKKTAAATTTTTFRNPLANFQVGRRLRDGEVVDESSSSIDPNAMSRINVKSMKAICDYLDEDRRKRFGISNTTTGSSSSSTQRYDGYVLDRPAQSSDLAYSKGRKNQLWIPFIEKAYCKVYGSYKAISGGHIAEAFLDLTGAPTLQIQWHQNNNATFLDSCVMEPRPLWSKLLQWRSQRLPMGCGTDSSAGGIIGMHAYSILDVREINNVGVGFFQDQLVRGILGNVSGFTEYDGKVRLLRIRNPHGKGEWKGDFSDKSDAWGRLLASSGVSLPRTNADDGTFWIGYDDFLMGFSNIDVVLAFEGNHAKSFTSHFPEKKSNHRCTRAFEVSLLDPQPGIATKDLVEVYVMGIQKSGRGARRGRSDRKKSYKVSDLGLIVGEYPVHNEEELGYVHGQMFGFRRNGHYRLLLDRRRCRRMVVMPISFGHPAAADKELSYVVRFNADAPLMIRELPQIPRMDYMLQEFIFGSKPSNYYVDTRQGRQTVLFETHDCRVVQIDYLGNHGGTVFVYLCMDDSDRRSCERKPISLVLTATCRGMSCRVNGKLLDHETVAKGKKFEASWRRYTSDFIDLSQSRLLMVIYQSGQDTEMGSISCQKANRLGVDLLVSTRQSPQSKIKATTLDQFWTKSNPTEAFCSGYDDTVYAMNGIFHSIPVDTKTFHSCGKNEMLVDIGIGSSMADHIGGGGRVTRDDTELQRALDLSRREDDLQRAIKASLEDHGNGADRTFTGGGFIDLSANHVADADADGNDADLQEALRRSVMETGKEIIFLEDDD